jgi:hypothetical protein
MLLQSSVYLEVHDFTNPGVWHKRSVYPFCLPSEGSSCKSILSEAAVTLQ